MLNWFHRPAASRRRAVHQWNNQDVSQTAEVLEHRVVPSCLASSHYYENGPDGVVDLTVDPSSGKGPDTGTLNLPSIGRFAVKIKCKKNGNVTVKADSPGVKGSAVMRKSDVDPNAYLIDIDIRTNTERVSLATYLNSIPGS